MGTLTIQNVADDLRAAMLAAWKMPRARSSNESAILGFYAIGDANPALSASSLPSTANTTFN